MAHLCKLCLSKTKVVLLAMLVEVITFIPTHAFFEWVGLLG